MLFLNYSHYNKLSLWGGTYVIQGVAFDPGVGVFTPEIFTRPPLDTHPQDFS